jgi:hypothetical protein
VTRCRENVCGCAAGGAPASSVVLHLIRQVAFSFSVARIDSYEYQTRLVMDSASSPAVAILYTQNERSLS